VIGAADLSEGLARLGLGAPALAVAALVVLVSGMLRGLTGFGFAIAAVPLLSTVLSPRLAVAVAALLQLAVGFANAPRAWKLADRASLAPLLVGAVIGTPLGMAALRLAPVGPQRLAVAAAALLALVAAWRGPRLETSIVGRRPAAAGVASGLLNGLAAMPGPPVVAHFLNAPIEPAAARASLTLYFAATAVFATASGLAAGIIDARAAALAVICAPLLFAGDWLGGRLFRAGGERLFRPAAVAVLAAAAGIAAARGLADVL